MQLLANAQIALNRGDLASAQRFALQARDLNVPESAYGPGEMRPWMLLLQVDKAQRQQGVAADNPAPAAAGSQVRQAVVSPLDLADERAVRPAAAEELVPRTLVAQQDASPFDDDTFGDDVEVFRERRSRDVTRRQ